MSSRIFKRWRPLISATKDVKSIQRRGFLQISEEVRNAVREHTPVVALESTIYTHGFPYPDNVALAASLEDIVRENGAVPATIGVLNGIARVGLNAEELNELTASAGKPMTMKLSRRDLGYICGLGFTGRNLNGGTTIAGTMVLAHLAGIKIFATGGLGGVHRGGENSMDISADLTELGRTPVTVISSGCKSFLDIPRTLEFLETQGVCVGTFSDDREGKVQFPAFWTRESGILSPLTIKDEKEAAAIIYAQSRLGIHSGIHLANPIPEKYSIAKERMDTIIGRAISEADALGISGSHNTPFILAKIRELTHGNTVAANKFLVEANVVRGTKVAVELAKLDLQDSRLPIRDPVLEVPATTEGRIRGLPIEESGLVGDELSMSVSQDKSFSEHAEVIVAGAVAIDLSCDFIPQKIANHSIDPLPRTSNSANITQSLGGVGQNVATALSYLGTSVRLCSIIAEDVAGSSILEMLAERGLSSKGIEKIRGSSTGRYIAINDSHKNLVLAMADMKILEERSDFGLRWKPHIDACKPKWLVVDANWEEDTLFNWIAKGKSSGARIAYEPVSTTKAKRLFTTLGSSSYEHDLEVFPNNALSLASPNSLELASMYAAAREAGVFDRESWWQIIDRMGMSSLGSRNKLTAITNSALVDEGVPQQSIQLLPFIPTIVTKLGERGVLLTELLQPDDKRLTSSASAPYILSHSAHDKKVGGVFMRLFAPIETVPQDQILSVNGVGDTFLGVLVAGLVRNRSVEAIIDVAQKGSVLTLKSKEAVSPDISTLHLF